MTDDFLPITTAQPAAQETQPAAAPSIVQDGMDFGPDPAATTATPAAVAPKAQQDGADDFLPMGGPKPAAQAQAGGADDFLPIKSSVQPDQADDVAHVFSHGLLAQESGGRQLDAKGRPVTSPKGAIGIAQVMPGTAPEAAALAGVPYDDIKYRTDADYNKKLGLAYLRKQFADFGNMPMALAAYNGGPDALRRAIENAKHSGNPDGWLNFMRPETRAYVPAVLARAGRVPMQAAPQGDGGTNAAGPNYLDVQPAKERSWGDVAKDTALSVAAGGAGLVNSVGELYGLASGDMNNVVSRVSSAVQNYLQSQQSDQLQQKRQARDQAVAQDDGGLLSQAWTAFAQTVSDPTLLADVVAGNAATMIPGGIAGRLTARAIGGLAMTRAMEAGPVSLAARQAIAKSAAEWGVGGAKVAMAVQQGADVASQAYTDAMAKKPEQLVSNPEYVRRVKAGEDPQQVQHDLAVEAARATFLPAGAISVAANSLPGGDAVERALVGGAATKAGLAGKLPARMAKAAGGEALTEALEEGGGQAAANVANQQIVDPNQDLTNQVGYNAGVGAAGGFGQGAPAGVFHHGGQPEPAAVPPGLEVVAGKAAQPNSPLSRAAMAGNTGPLADATRAAQEQQQQQEQAAASQPDELTKRAAQIAAAIREKGALDALRSKDSPVKVQKVLEDLALAQSPSTQQHLREQAINRLQTALEWAGVNPAAQAAPAVQQIVGTQTDPTAAPDGAPAQRTTAQLQAQVDASTGNVGPQYPGPNPLGVPYDNTDAAAQRAQQAQQQQASNEEAAAKLPAAPDVDRVIEVLRIEPALRSAEQTALVKQAAARYQPEDMQLLQQAATYAAGMSATQKLRVQQLRGVANPALVVARDEGKQQAADIADQAPPQTEPDLGTVVPNSSTPAPAGAGPAVFRKRRATLRQLIDMGMTQVVREGNQFLLTDGKKRFLLDGPADAQLARREIQGKIAEGANQANTNPTDGQKQAGNYKKGRVDFDGMKIGVENPIGSERAGTAPDGSKWSVKMSAHYGDLTSTTGADGDGVDVYLVEHPRAGSPVWVFDQYNDDGSFDEHKVVLGVPTQAEAEKVYDAHFSDGSGPRRRRAVTEMTVDKFKAWANSPKAKKPAAGGKSGKAGHVAAAAPAATVGRGGDHAAGGVAPAGAGRASGHVGDGGDNPATGAERSGGETGALDHGGERAYVTVRVKGRKKQVPVIDITKLSSGSSVRDGARTQVSRESAELIRSIAKIFGKEVVFFQDPELDLGDGFVLPQANSAIFVNEYTSIQPMAVFGHELMHQLRREMPQVHAAISAVVAARVKDGGRKAFRDDYNGKSKEHTDEALNSRELEELTSDLGGNLMADAGFWREVMDQVQKDHPNEAKTLVAQLAAKLYALIDRLLAALAGEPKFRAEEFVSDLKSIRAAMRDGVAQYVAAHNITGMPGEVARQSNIRAAASDTVQSPKRDNAEDVRTEDHPAGELGRGAAEAAGEIPEYGTPREGAVSVIGRHYGTQARKELSSAAYGRGYKGGETDRIKDAHDKRLRDRIYFYVDHGHGVQPESGVGPYAHEVRLNNIYDPRTKLIDHSGGGNAFESRVIDAGFDGYLNPNFTTKQGAVVLLGKHDVPVKPLGMESRKDAAPEDVVAPEILKKGLLSRELRDLDVGKIPGAKVDSGNLVIPAASKDEANAELERVGSDARFSKERAARSAEEQELIELRKQISVLDSIERCLG